MSEKMPEDLKLDKFGMPQQSMEVIQQWVSELNKLPKDQKILVTSVEDYSESGPYDIDNNKVAPVLDEEKNEMTADDLIKKLGFYFDENSPQRQQIMRTYNQIPKPEDCSIIKWEVIS